jgi:hypothetical protein
MAVPGKFLFKHFRKCIKLFVVIHRVFVLGPFSQCTVSHPEIQETPNILYPIFSSFVLGICFAWVCLFGGGFVLRFF